MISPTQIRADECRYQDLLAAVHAFGANRVAKA
jgi:hypothetical protein